MRAALILLLLAAGTGAVAQTPQFTVTTAAVDSVPQTTVVPVQDAPVSVVEHSVVYEKSTRGLDRREKRRLKAELYAARLDSLMESRNYMFFPNTMQELPGGIVRQVYADYYFLGMFLEHAEVCLPYERGITQYENMWNFDVMSLADYRAVKMQRGWLVSFHFKEEGVGYRAVLNVSTSTGESVLTLSTPAFSMKYVGAVRPNGQGYGRWKQEP